jgi:hypothetical protein
MLEEKERINQYDVEEIAMLAEY